LTAIVTDAVALPPELVAVTVYATAPASIAGVPLMTPVVVLRLKPAGRAGFTEYEITVPPLLAGAFGVIGVLMVYVDVPAP
jgi:hypothetical protein